MLLRSGDSHGKPNGTPSEPCRHQPPLRSFPGMQRMPQLPGLSPACAGLGRGSWPTLTRVGEVPQRAAEGAALEALTAGVAVIQAGSAQRPLPDSFLRLEHWDMLGHTTPFCFSSSAETEGARDQ